MKRKSTGRSPRQTKLQFVKRGSQPDKEAKLVTPDTSFNSSDDVSAAPIKAEADATPSSKASTTKAGISASPAKSKPGAPPLNAPTPAASDHDVLSEESDSESDDDEPARKKGDFRALRASNRADIEKHMRSVETAAKRAGQPIPGVSRGGAARPAAPPRRRSGHGPSTRAAEKKPPPVPTRASARLAGIKAEQPGEEGAAAGRLRGEIADLHATSGDNSAHRKRKVGDLALADIATGQANGGMDVLKGLGDTKGVKTFTEEDIRQTTDKELKALREQFARLQLYKKWEPNNIKLAPQRIYTIAFHPTETKPVVFAGDKEGNVSVFDASQAGPKHGWDEVVEEEDEDDSGYIEPTVHTFQPHVRPVSSFALPFNNPNALLSSSYDGSIRMLDLDKLTSVFVAGLGDDDDLGGRDSSISAIDVHADEPNLVWFTTQGAVLACHDMRTKLGGGGRKSKPVRSWVVGSTKVGGFGLHPLRAHLAATASNDRTMRVWDLRATVRGFFDDKDVPVDECSLSPGMLGMHESGYSVITATWSAGGAVATTCYDDHLRLFDLSKDVDKWKYTTELGSKPHYMDPDLPQIEPTRAIRHSCQTGRWVTQLKPAWQRRPQDGVQKLVVGNMDRFVDVFAESGERIAQLGGETDPVTGRQLISAVPAAAALHPSMNWVAGGTASGKLTLWM